MSDLTDLYDNAADLLARLREAEKCYAYNEISDLYQELAHVDPIDVQQTIADLRELSIRQKALDELGGGTTGSSDGTADTTRGPAPALREVAPTAPEVLLCGPAEFSVKVPCD